MKKKRKKVKVKLLKVKPLRGKIFKTENLNKLKNLGKYFAFLFLFLPITAFADFSTINKGEDYTVTCPDGFNNEWYVGADYDGVNNCNSTYGCITGNPEDNWIDGTETQNVIYGYCGSEIVKINIDENPLVNPYRIIYFNNDPYADYSHLFTVQETQETQEMSTALKAGLNLILIAFFLMFGYKFFNVAREDMKADKQAFKKAKKIGGSKGLKYYEQQRKNRLL
jgi:hypothetical protein